MRIAICNYDESALVECKELLQAIADRHSISVKFDEYRDSKSLLLAWKDFNNWTDVVFLETSMQEINGIEVARKLRENGYSDDIVFLTNNSSYVFEAFDVEAYHYIVKDEVGKHKVEDIFLNINKRYQKKKKEFISISFAGESRNIMVDEISCFEVNGRIITVSYGEGQTFQFYSTLGKVEKALHSRGFIRIHRCAIVNAHRVRRANGERVEMKSGMELPISRQGWKELKLELDKLEKKKGASTLNKEAI